MIEFGNFYGGKKNHDTRPNQQTEKKCIKYNVTYTYLHMQIQTRWTEDLKGINTQGNKERKLCIAAKDLRMKAAQRETTSDKAANKTQSTVSEACGLTGCWEQLGTGHSSKLSGKQPGKMHPKAKGCSELFTQESWPRDSA